jgi:hypothetical protein
LTGRNNQPSLEEKQNTNYSGKKKRSIGKNAVIIDKKKVLFLPLQLSPDFVLGYASLKEVLFFGKVNGLRHPRERVVYVVLCREPNALKTSVGDVLYVLFESGGVHSEDTFRENFFCKSVFKNNGAADEVNDVLLEFLRPEFRLFFFDGIHNIDTEIQVLGLVAHDVLNLLGGTNELVLALETKHDGK